MVGGVSKNRIVFSQFSQGELGLYMATNREWKYIYSAADNKEWLYDLVHDPKEIDNLIDDPACQEAFRLLKKACIQRFVSDGYHTALEGDDWKRFTPKSPPRSESDDGLLFQDPNELEDQIEALGRYARSSDFTKDEQYQMLKRLFEA